MTYHRVFVMSYVNDEAVDDSAVDVIRRITRTNARATLAISSSS